MMHVKPTIPTVMFDSLLEQCALATYCETAEARKLVDEEGLDFSKVQVLKLEFKNILKITNLWDFVSLKELNLSNNRIEQIEGLDNLVNLVKLDLSFNQIETISALDALTSLTDLNFTGNRITTIENLDALNKLELLALRDNMITDFETVQYLYTFRSIRSVSFCGNPIAITDGYHLKVIAFIPSLTYLDYRLISDEEKEKAVTNYENEILELEEKVKKVEKIKVEKQTKDDTKKTFSEAFLFNMNDNQFYEEISNCHEDSLLLFSFETLLDNYNEFSNAFRSEISDFIEDGLSEYEQRKNEMKMFQESVTDSINWILEESREVIFEFSEFKEDLLLKISLLNEDDDQKTDFLQSLRKHLVILWKSLMSLEQNLCHQLTEMKSLYFSVLEVMVESYSEKIKKHMLQFRQLLEDFTINATTFYLDWTSKPQDERLQIVKAASNSGVVSSELTTLLKLNGESLQSVLSKGNEMRNAIVVERENLLLSKLAMWYEELMDSYHDKELERHRKHIREITYYCTAVRKEIDAL